MEKLLISAGAVFFVSCGAMGEPKQAWERPRTESTEAKKDEPPAATTEASAPAKEPSHEDVCRKMWSLISEDAVERAKHDPKVKVPTDKHRTEFLQDCYSSGADQKKANPEKYGCLRKCIIDSKALADFETCNKPCK
jgi:hypothetical protein